MAWQKKRVYVITAFYANFEESGYSYPSEEYFAETLEEADRKKAKLQQDTEFEAVYISHDRQIREFWTSGKAV